MFQNDQLYTKLGSQSGIFKRRHPHTYSCYHKLLRQAQEYTVLEFNEWAFIQHKRDLVGLFVIQWGGYSYFGMAALLCSGYCTLLTNVKNEVRIPTFCWAFYWVINQINFAFKFIVYYRNIHDKKQIHRLIRLSRNRFKFYE